MIARLENLALAAALAALALLPMVEIVLRATLHVGVAGAGAFTQHFALIAGMLGAAVAAREGRLLSLSTLQSVLTGRLLGAAQLFTGAVAVIVTALLFVAMVIHAAPLKPGIPTIHFTFSEASFNAVLAQ
jgi:TRAP-type C4-dicarboxylate transport system permease small subunit